MDEDESDESGIVVPGLNAPPVVGFDEEIDRVDDKISNKRRRSRSRSKDGSRKHGKRRRSRSRSKSRDRNVDLQQYRRNPDVQNLVKRMVEEQVQEELNKRRKLETTSGSKLNYEGKKFISPSDTSVYTPAVGKSNWPLSGSPHDRHVHSHEKHVTLHGNHGNNMKMITDEDINMGKNSKLVSPNVFSPDTINETLTQLRIISDQKNEKDAATSRRRQEIEQRDQISNAKGMAEAAILEAERHRARVQQPNRGKDYDHITQNNTPIAIKFNNPSVNCGQQNEILRNMRYLDNEDDEFFHTTCHIEAALKDKIKVGQFVELDKLIQKRVLQSGPKDESRMQLVNRDGVSYFVPTVDRETKIDNVKKWEQAFRVYTTIYCEANPSRAGEILQYIDIIHRAAAIFNWDNVAKYDYVFRQLMAAKPYRSWAKVYTQMWNITLNEPIKKFNENGSSASGNSNHNNNHKGGKKRDSYCWKYNKSTCTYGRNCRFEHKCSYCGTSGHPVSNCHKKHGKKTGSERSEKGKINSSSN